MKDPSKVRIFQLNRGERQGGERGRVEEEGQAKEGDEGAVGYRRGKRVGQGVLYVYGLPSVHNNHLICVCARFPRVHR